MTLLSHRREDPISEFMGTEKVRLELVTQHLSGKVLDRPGLTESPVIEKGVEFSIGSFQDAVHGLLDAVAVCKIEPQRFEAPADQIVYIRLFSRGGEDPVSSIAQTDRGNFSDSARASTNQYRAFRMETVHRINQAFGRVTPHCP